MAEDAVCSDFPRLIAHQKEMIQGTSQILDDPIQQLLLRGLRARPWEDFLTFWRDNDSTSRSASNPDRIRDFVVTDRHRRGIGYSSAVTATTLRSASPRGTVTVSECFPLYALYAFSTPGLTS